MKPVQGRNRIFSAIAVVMALLLGLTIAVYSFHKNADALWEIVSEKCVPGQQQRGQPAPCENVDFTQGYVTLKDRVGPLQYLLMPVAKITGIESPQLLSPESPNFFAQSWQERQLMTAKHGAAVPDSAVSLAINSEYGRTQNQLHIHISCLRGSVRRQLDTLEPAPGETWQPVTILNHLYLIRTLTPAQLMQKSVFIRLADEVPEARNEMGKYGMSLAALPDGRLALMAVKLNWLKLNRGSAEEIQDHSCQILSR